MYKNKGIEKILNKPNLAFEVILKCKEYYAIKSTHSVFSLFEEIMRNL